MILFSKSEKNEKSLFNSHFLLVIANLILTIFLWYSFDKSFSGFQFVEEQNWISGFIKFKFGIALISILFIVLTAFITPICIISCLTASRQDLKNF